MLSAVQLCLSAETSGSRGGAPALGSFGRSQYTVIHASLTARDFILAYCYPLGPVTCIFPNLSQFFPVLAVTNTGSCVGPQNKIGHPVGCRFPC